MFARKCCERKKIENEKYLSSRRETDGFGIFTIEELIVIYTRAYKRKILDDLFS